MRHLLCLDRKDGTVLWQRQFEPQLPEHKYQGEGAYQGYAGSTPTGFDCSGLVQYSYAKVGVRLSRDTRALLDMSAPVAADNLRRGDLLFFDEDGKKLSHVAIYLGSRRFVHAPSSGGKVRTDSLDAAYWRKHFVEARRL